MKDLKFKVILGYIELEASLDFIEPFSKIPPPKQHNNNSLKTKKATPPQNSQNKAKRVTFNKNLKRKEKPTK